MKTKHSLRIVIALLAIIMLLAVSASALEIESGTCGDNLTWDYVKKTNTLYIYGSGAMESYSDASNVPWSSLRDEITDVVIEDGITSIGENAFCNFTNLVEVEIPTSVTVIGDKAFYKCVKLPEIIIHDKIKAIGSSAYEGCVSVLKLTIPDNVTIIGKYAFKDCANIGELTIGSGIKNINVGTFEGLNNRLTEVVIPENVETIEEYAFSGCTKVTSVKVGDNLKKIGAAAFEDCESLQIFMIPNGITTINDRMFAGCKSLLSVVIPEGVTSIGADAFAGCVSLCDIFYGGNDVKWNLVEKKSGWDSFGGATPEVHYNASVAYGSCGAALTWRYEPCGLIEGAYFAEGILYIYGEGDMADFEKETDVPWSSKKDDIVAVIMSEDITSIGKYAFYDCSSLRRFEVSENINNNNELPDGIKSIGDFAFSKNEALSRITLPEKLVTIGDYAFDECTALDDVVTFDRIKHIGAYAFDSCVFTSFNIPDSVLTIGEGAFANCASLAEVVIPDRVTAIENDTFAFCRGLVTVTIPKTVTKIGEEAFMECSGLETISFTGTKKEWEDLETGLKWDYNAGASVNAPVRYNVVCTTVISSGTCGEALNWSYNSDNTLTISGTGEMANYSNYESAPWHFYNGSIEKIVVNVGATSIGNYAFFDFGALKKVILPEGITSIGENAFLSCDTLSGVVLPESLTTIGNAAFKSSGIVTIEIPAGITAIANDTFRNCKSLTEIIIPKTVKTIGSYAFAESSIEKITIEDGVTSIGNNAFVYCDDLAEINIPASVTSIGDNAFLSCGALENINVAEENSAYASLDGVLYTKDMKTLICYPQGKADSIFTIPYGVTEIKSNAFIDNNKLQKVYVAITVNHIGEWAFSECLCLDEFIYDGTAEMWNAAAFVKDNKWDYKTGSAVTGGTYKVSCYFAAGQCGESVSWKLDDNGVLTIFGKGDMKDYSATEHSPWFIDTTEEGLLATEPQKVNYIIKKVIIEDGVTSIGAYAFERCLKLESVEISDSVISIGDAAFKDCKVIKEISIGDNVTYLGASAFSGCVELTDVVLGAGIIKIYPNTFDGCKKLSNLIIIGRLFNIMKQAFKGCEALTEISFADSLISIGDESFIGCKGLTSVQLPQNIRTIGAKAFYDCTSLVSVKFGGTKDEWAAVTKGSQWDGYSDTATDEDRKYTVTFDDGIISVTGVSLNKKEHQLAVGKQYTFRWSVFPSNATNQKVTWRSSDEGVVTVEDGVITAVGVGTATITVETVDGHISQTCVITVVERALPVVSVKDVIISVSSNKVFVDVEIIDNPGIAGMAFGLKLKNENGEFVNYNSCGLIPEEIILDGVFAGSALTSNIYDPYWDGELITVVINGANNKYTNGTVCRIEFTVDKDKLVADTEYTFEFVGVLDNPSYIGAIAASNDNGETVDTQSKPGTLSVFAGIYGDLNCDFEVDIKDAVLLAQYLAQWTGLTLDLDAADCNGDGFIDIKDAVLLAQYLSKWDVDLGPKN